MIEGGISEIHIPFDNLGRLDVGKLKGSIKWLQGHQIKYFMINGIGAESLTMTKEERLASMRAAVEIAGGENLMAYVGSTNPEEITEYIRSAHDMGIALGIITQPPIMQVKDPLLYFNKLADNSKLDLVLYNERSLGYLLTPLQTVKILKHERFVGYKDSTKDYSHLMEVAGGLQKKVNLYAGSDSLIFGTYVLGGIGIVSLIINAFPTLVFDLISACKDGSISRAWSAQVRINAIREILKSYGFSAGYREAARMVGNDMGFSRIPGERLNDEEKATLAKRLREEKIVT